MPAPQEQGKPFQVTTIQETGTSITFEVAHGKGGVILTDTPQIQLGFCLAGKRLFRISWLSPRR